jgi:hypothetical protein
MRARSLTWLSQARKERAVRVGAGLSRLRYADAFGRTADNVIVAIESQRSSLQYDMMEARTLDYTNRQLPVMWLFSETLFNHGRGGPNQVSLPLWVRHWAHRHGRQQLISMDPTSGTLYWTRLKSKETGPIRTIQERRSIVPGQQSADGKQTLEIIVDETRSSKPGAPNLLIATFGWVAHTAPLVCAVELLRSKQQPDRYRQWRPIWKNY